MKQFIRSTLDRLGIETNRSTTLRRFISLHPIDLVIDAGANIGQFGRSIRDKGYRGRIWSFEPVSSVFDVLRQTSAGDSNWAVSQFALGDQENLLHINVPANHTLSSFLQPSGLMKSFNAEGSLAVEEVAVKRLDDLLADDPSRRVFLKADVQGFERQVLDGAEKILDRVHAIHLELPIGHLYEGGWTFPEAIAHLDSLGFTPAQFRSVNSMPDDRASAVEFDCLFRRK